MTPAEIAAFLGLAIAGLVGYGELRQKVSSLMKTRDTTDANAAAVTKTALDIAVATAQTNQQVASIAASLATLVANGKGKRR